MHRRERRARRTCRAVTSPLQAAQRQAWLLIVELEASAWKPGSPVWLGKSAVPALPVAEAESFPMGCFDC